MPAYSSVGTAGSVSSDACAGTYEVTAQAPGTVNAGDILIYYVGASTFGGTVDSQNPPPGFTALKSVGGGTGRMVSIFYRVADGSEDNTSYTCNGTYSSFLCIGGAKIWSFTGSGTGGVVGASGSTGSGSDTSAEMPAVTTTQANSLAVAFVACNGSTVGEATGESGGDWVKPLATQALTNNAVALHTANMASIGTISGGSSTLSGGSLWEVMTFEIKEAVTAAGRLFAPPLRHLQHLLIR